MGTGQSKNSPDEQLRMRMENGFDDDDDDDVEPIGVPEKTLRSKSNLSFHTSERHQNPEDEEYFNQIYNKRAEKSLTSVNGSSGISLGVKSAPPGPKREKDPEVDAAIAELEETFKNLGENGPKVDGGVTENSSEQVSTVQHDAVVGESSENILDVCDSPLSASRAESSTREMSNSESGMDSPSLSPPCQIRYDRHLITRAGESNDPQGLHRGPRKLLELNNSRGVSTSSGTQNSIYISSGSSRGSESRGLLVSQSGFNGFRNSGSTTESKLMQQRKDFQKKYISNKKAIGGSEDTPPIRQEDWTYEPPKIDGFDIDKFKEINSKKTSSTIVPIILRDDDDKGYYSRSPEIPAYTRDELELIATLEREVY